MEEVILLKLGEITLKGQNRRSFEERLIKNLKRRLKPHGLFEIKSVQSTIYLIPKDGADMDAAEQIAAMAFGVVAYARASVTEKKLDCIQKEAVNYLKNVLEEVKTFKVETRRSDKKFPLQSPEISMEVGGYLLENFPNLSVNVKKPEVVVRIEIRETSAYIYANAKKGAGGIPVGTGGSAAILISGGLDSPIAAWMMAKRGVELTPIHFASPPYTSEFAHQKVVDLLGIVGAYAGCMKMITVNFTKLQEAIRDNCPDDLGTVILRRFMLKASERIAREQECGALITGESLGQVASQTMQAIACTDAAVDMPIFRPLIGMDKSEVVKIAQDIDTYETSIKPYEDCCTIFTPKHPRTKPKLDRVEFAEKSIDGDALLEEALQDLRTTIIRD